MNTQVLKQKGFVFLLLTILMVTFSTQSISYAQEANPTITASVEEPLTEATLFESVVTLTLSGGRFADESNIQRALSISGIDEIFPGEVVRVNDTAVTVLLVFFGNIDTDATLTFTVEADAILGYNGNALTATLPVTAIEESLTASTETPLTEATLQGSSVTLTLSGRAYEDWIFEGTVSVSGIEGVTIESWNVERISDTELTAELTFSGDLDSNATLTFTVAAEAIAGGYDGPPLTAEVPVTARQRSNATVNISPASVICPDIGEALTFSLNIKDGENIAGYQATVLFNPTVLDYVKSANGDYLPADAFFMPPIVIVNEDWIEGTFFDEGILTSSVTLAASTLAGASNGDGTLATLTFKVEDFKASTLTISQVYLVDVNGTRWETFIENGEVTIPPEPENAILEDINHDGVVNIQDLVIVNARFGQRGPNSADINGDGVVNIVDLVLVAGAFGNGAAAPALHPQPFEMLITADIQRWLSQAQQLELTDAASLRGILFLQQLLTALIPKETALLPNYPNPFNPETWIPYRLSKPADVTLAIYAVDGQMVRRLSLGHQPAGMYQSRSRAAHWDGKNEFGEPVASGVYFYTLSTESTRDSVTAGGFTATRKMLIRK